MQPTRWICAGTWSQSRLSNQKGAVKDNPELSRQTRAMEPAGHLSAIVPFCHMPLGRAGRMGGWQAPGQSNNVSVSDIRLEQALSSWTLPTSLTPAQRWGNPTSSTKGSPGSCTSQLRATLANPLHHHYHPQHHLPM